MNASIRSSFAAVALVAVSATVCRNEADAQRRHKLREAEFLDGKTVLLAADGQKAAPVPVEEKLKRYGRPGIEYAPGKTVYLYPLGQNRDQGIVENGVAVTRGPKTANGLTGPETAGKHGFIGNVTDSARIDIYLPEKGNGQMVLCCPGGGYRNLSSWNEGTYVAKWMNDRGIACGVVKYRLPNGHREIPLLDVQNAFRYCRHHAAEWGVNQIGVIGFSAGGHLATTVETMYVDSLTRPDFAIVIYPVVSMHKGITHQGTHDNLLGRDVIETNRNAYSFEQWYDNRMERSELEDMYSTHRDVTASTPPTFIGVSTDDKTVPVGNSVLFYKALVEHDVPTELHIYPYGGHGWGFTDLSIGLDRSVARDILHGCRQEFSNALSRWLRGLRAEKPEAPGRKPEELSIKPSRTVHLYPEGQNVDKGIEGITLGPGGSNGATGAEIIEKELHYRNVGDSARFTLYFPEDSGCRDRDGNPVRRNGKMVVICPGGSYWVSAQLTEGRYAAEWFLRQGVSVALVNYRMPCGRWQVPLTDVQNTLRYCRRFAAQWGITSIGIVGFSAGGHLAASASTLYVDKATRPDFSILIYPVITMEQEHTHQGTRNNLIGTDKAWDDRNAPLEGTQDSFTAWSVRGDRHKELIRKYSLENQVSTDTPPTFIALSSNDKGVLPENAIRYYEALVGCGVPCEMHSFPGGGHGWGFRNNPDPLGEFREDFLASLGRFLREWE